MQFPTTSYEDIFMTTFTKDHIFWDAPMDALFNQKDIAKVLQISEAKLERDHWSNSGIRYLKLGKSVRYRKRDVLNWLEQYAPTVKKED